MFVDLTLRFQSRVTPAQGHNYIVIIIIIIIIIIVMIIMIIIVIIASYSRPGRC